MKRNMLAALLVFAGGLTSNLFAQYGPYQSDPYYDDGYGQGIYAPAPPPLPAYAYSRPPMPGPGYVWVNGYWNYARPRYQWVTGYWAMPPYPGGYWVAPRYTGNRFFVGFWGGGGGGYGYRAPVQVYRPQIYINRGNNGRGRGNAYGHRR